MEMKEKVSLMLKAALEYNSTIIARSVEYYQLNHVDRKTHRQFIKDMQHIQKGYMKQLDQILNQLEEEVEVS